MALRSFSFNHKGEPCKQCGETIEVYCLSGYCRTCWHSNRNRAKIITPKIEKALDASRRCKCCGRIIEKGDVCPSCLAGDDAYLNRYRIFRGQPEHRFLYELDVEPIPLGWVIHHLNGLKGDNRKENLVTMPKGDHDSKAIVTELKKRIRDLEKQLKEVKNG